MWTSVMPAGRLFASNCKHFSINSANFGWVLAANSRTGLSCARKSFSFSFTPSIGGNGLGGSLKVVRRYMVAPKL